ncbi:MAG: TatD family hydrolase [Gammaproteobacteria bacterium]|nr:TatD family hydrolase [Gammaproteobacteria bacterium]
MPLIDIGANLSHSSFQQDLDTVLAEAKTAGVAHIIMTGTDLESIRTASKLRDHYPEYLTLTAGFHPHVASDFDDEAKAAILHYGTLPQVVAIGETGLDFNRNYSPRDVQEDAFASQLEIACELNKPVFLHQRDAHESFHGILRSFRDRLPGGVVHCFTDTRQALYDYLDLDMYIGVTGWICDERRGKELQELVADIPGERLLIETDAPYLLPRSLKPAPKSRRNEPKYLVEVLNMISKCSGIDQAALAANTVANAQRLFGLPDQQGTNY